MAALPESPEIRVVDLCNISAPELAPVLQEELHEWRAALHWDLSSSTELVERFAGMQALNGCALMAGARVIGYSYFVCEDRKALIGDLYVMKRERTPERERALIDGSLETLWRESGLRRVEAQWLMLDPGTRPSGRLPFATWFRSYPRLFLEVETGVVPRLRECSVSNIGITNWLESRHQEPSGWLVAAAYRGHSDSEINDQYRSPGGARRFLTNIVQYPGCGTFFAPASFAVFDQQSHTLCGIVLASLIAEDAGHITQVCVAPSHKGVGLGYELMRRALVALGAQGCRTVSLTVTASNHEALRLYERMGFTKKRDFSAFVWQEG